MNGMLTAMMPMPTGGRAKTGQAKPPEVLTWF
jgi:hypothetical protein